jgi:DNA-binding NtrC family response regulator
VRELQNFVKRHIVLANEDLAIAELTGGVDIGIAVPGGTPVQTRKLKSIVRNVKNGAEAIAITEALQQTNWKRKQAAALLGISYKALLYKIRLLEIMPPEKTGSNG